MTTTPASATLTAAQVAAAVGLCPGSGEFVHEDSVDGASMTWCPRCSRRREAYPVGVDHPGWFAVQGHPPLVHPELGIHSPACEVALIGVCTCTGRSAR